jgi:inner membrane protein
VDVITHLLAGACLGRARLNRKTALATITVTLAAAAPDLDMLGGLKGGVFGFAHNRGFTHSFVGIALVAAAVVGFMYTTWRLWRRKVQDPSSAPRGWLFAFAYLGGLSHILLDFADNYGVRPYWPFSGKWYSWDIVFVADPIVILLLLGGLLLPALSNLISEELGARRKAPYGRLGTALALMCVVTLWGIRNYEHRRGVVETRNFFATMPVDSLTPEVDPDGEIEFRYNRASRNGV